MPTPSDPATWPAANPFPADAIPLKHKQRTLTCDPVGVVLDNLHPNVRLNSAESTDGAAVLGCASPSGQSSFFDIKLGKVCLTQLLSTQLCWCGSRHCAYAVTKDVLLSLHVCSFHLGVC